MFCKTIKQNITYIFICMYLPLIAQVPFTCEDQFFLTLSTNPPKIKEVVIDPQTNAVVFSPINDNMTIDVNAAGYRSTDNFIYAIAPDTKQLIRIDANGQTVALATLALNNNNSYFAGDISPDGRYLVLIGSQFLSTGVAVAADFVRVDLTSPNYALSINSINQQAQIFDIAFHPQTEQLYGYDSQSQRLVRINSTNGDITFPFPSAGVPVLSGSLFFDAYGDLFAYGSPNFMADQNSLYRIDINNGQSTFLTQGEPAVSSDGCSCPYTVELSKSVLPEKTSPCTDVEYTFEILNTSGRTHLGMRLDDQLPAGFTFVSVSSNPLGGTVVSQPGDTYFRLDNFSLPDGKFKIKIIVNTGNVSAGIYKNQAQLFNLPASLGGTRKSDNLKTLAKDDSTEVLILNFDFDTIRVAKTLCEGSDTLVLDASVYTAAIGNNVEYLWSDASTLSSLAINNEGEYQATLTSGCDTAFVIYTIQESGITVVLDPTEATINLGDSIQFASTVTNQANTTLYRWRDPQPGSIRCNDCTDTWARPFNDILYTLVVQNELGCKDSANINIKVNKNKNVYFPNVFGINSQSPDNNYFFPSGDAFTRIKLLAVYSRWGELMFEAKDIALNDPASGWEGQYRGKMAQPGVYAWLAKVVFLDGTEITYYGDVTLIK